MTVEDVINKANSEGWDYYLTAYGPTDPDEIESDGSEFDEEFISAYRHLYELVTQYADALAVVQGFELNEDEDGER